MASGEQERPRTAATRLSFSVLFGDLGGGGEFEREFLSLVVEFVLFFFALCCWFFFLLYIKLNHMIETPGYSHLTIFVYIISHKKPISAPMCYVF